MGSLLNSPQGCDVPWRKEHTALLVCDGQTEAQHTWVRREEAFLMARLIRHLYRLAGETKD